jgi:hypothetical protein
MGRYAQFRVDTHGRFYCVLYVPVLRKHGRQANLMEQANLQFTTHTDGPNHQQTSHHIVISKITVGTVSVFGTQTSFGVSGPIVHSDIVGSTVVLRWVGNMPRHSLRHVNTTTISTSLTEILITFPVKKFLIGPLFYSHFHYEVYMPYHTRNRIFHSQS